MTSESDSHTMIADDWLPQYPTEGLPTEESSTLKDRRLQDGVSLVSKYLYDPKSNPQKLAQVVNFCANESDQQIVEQFINEQILLAKERGRSEDDEKIEKYNEIQDALRKEYEPPKNVHVEMRFEEHAVRSQNDFALTRDAFVARAALSFKPKESNILLLEDSDGLYYRDDKLFQEGLKKYGNYHIAMAYHMYIYINKNKPTEKELDGFLDLLKSQRFIERFPIESYRLAILEGVDDLKEKGIDLEIVWEKSDPKASNVSTMINSLEDYKNDRMKKVEFAKKRDAILRVQITDLVDTARRTGKKTNILTLLGTRHSILSSELPRRIKSAASITTDELSYPEITEFSEEDWQRAYDAYLSQQKLRQS